MEKGVTTPSRPVSPVIQRFLRYAAVHTTSDMESGTSPSAAREADLAELLVKELTELGASVDHDREHCYVYAKIPANAEGRHSLGFIAHLDTSPEASGEQVCPSFVEHYEGGKILLNEEKNIVLDPEDFPELLTYQGQTIIVTDGTTLLGADDKAGVAEIMDMAETLLTHPEIPHGDILIAFTPDEEIGEGTAHFDVARFGAEYGFTVDGGEIGELQYECFNAASAKIRIHGRNVHTGDAKGRMIHAARIGMELVDLLPSGERPEFTEQYEGFFHVLTFEGTAEDASMHILIRDHDKALFEEKKRLMESAVSYLQGKYPAATISLDLTDSYYNMKEKILPDNAFLLDKCSESMKELGIEPLIRPIRGGTDGATLSFKGLPCPNLCAGGHNFHGIYEYVPVESIEKIAKLLVLLADRLTR